MTFKEKTCVRILLFVAAWLAPEALAKEIANVAQDIRLYAKVTE